MTFHTPNQIDVMEPDTDQLISLARAGDLSAQQRLLSRHSSRLKQMIAVFLDPRISARVDPSDVLQETLTIAARRLPDYSDAMPGGFYPWLRQIAKDQIIDAHRKHIHAGKRSVEREIRNVSFVSDASASQLADRLVSKEGSPSAQAGHNERRAGVMAALKQLSDSNRELLLMRYVEQLSTREIAEILATTDSAIKSRLWRSLEKMNQIMVTGLEDCE